MKRHQITNNLIKETTRIILSVLILLSASLLVSQPERDPISIKTINKKSSISLQKNKSLKNKRNPSSHHFP